MPSSYENMGAVSTHRPCQLLALPAELRNSIYEFVFTGKPYPGGKTKVAVSKHHSFVELDGRYSVLSLLSTCRQIRDEAQGIFYSINMVSMKSARLPEFIDVTPTGRLSAITTLELTSCTATTIANRLSLLGGLTNLKQLRIEQGSSDRCPLAGLNKSAVCMVRVRMRLEELAERVAVLETFTFTTYGHPLSVIGGPGASGLVETEAMLQRIIDRVRVNRLAKGIEEALVLAME